MLPAAVSLRKQGANKGAVTSFLIATPESGVDSIAISYALLDPIMTVIRPVVAFCTAFIAGVSENLLGGKDTAAPLTPDLSCPIDGCCDGIDCPPEEHRTHHSFGEKLFHGLRYAFTDFWDDLAGSFFIGLILAGLISALIPEHFFTTYLGGGPWTMLIMMAAAIPLYICATASTPIAAALILKGVSPGAALVFLLAGPATNMASIAVLLRTLGKRSTALYLASIVGCSLLFGLLTDGLYTSLGLSAQAVAGESSETIPYWLALTGAVVLLGMSLRSFVLQLKRFLVRRHAGGKTAPAPDKTLPMAPDQKTDKTPTATKPCAPT